MGSMTGVQFATQARIFFSSPLYPEWLCGPTCFLYSGYWEFFPWA